MKEELPIKLSEFKNEFESTDSINTFLLSGTKAKFIWERFVDKNNYTFNRLASSHWLFSINKKPIGNWLNAYNNNEKSHVIKILERELDWNSTDTLYFIINSQISIKTTFEEFKNGWINFLMCYDDGPLLINENNSILVLDFTPLGLIRLFSHN